MKIDKAATDFYIRLTNLQSDYRRVGVNYNQTVKELRCHFSEKKAMALLYKLEQCTKELAIITRQVVELSREFQERWSQKSR